MNAAPFRQVKASAGSGKTYALTLRFLELLAGAQDESGQAEAAATGRACAAEGACPMRSYRWPEILAITFTNKAAAEMRARVLTALKRRALGRTDGPGQELAPGRAEALLQEILRHTEHLGVRTIDSLLSLLVRLFALDQGLRPDFDIVFDERQALEGLLDRFLDRCAAGGPEETLYTQAVRTLMEHEDKGGFWLQEHLRNRLSELAKQVLALGPEHAASLTVNQGQMADLLAMSYNAMRQAAAALAGYLEAQNLTGPAAFGKLLLKCQEAALFEGLKDSAYLAKESLADCLLVKCKARCTDEGERAYREFKAACRDYTRDHAILDAAYALAPCAAIARRMLEDMERVQREQGYVFGSQMAALACASLDGENGVPDAFCRLGDRLHHLLVDEFQDTSRAQWAASLPLASECLAKGGSLFYVGDVKQAIYGWRGGDAALFEEVAEDGELLAMSGGLARDALPCNWRSRPEIIRFNNAVFSRLGDVDTLHALAGQLLKDAPQPVVLGFVERMRQAFADAAQEVPDRSGEHGENGEPGRVQVRLLPAGRADEVVESALDALVQTLTEDLLPRRPAGDVAVLVRTGAHADLVCERLVAEGVPIITENSLLLARHPVVRQLVALLRLLDAPPDDVHFLAFLCGRELFLDESGLCLDDVLDWAARAKESPRREGKGGSLLSRFRDDFPDLHARLLAPFLLQTGLMKPYDLAQAALESYQVLARHPESELYVRRFLEVLHLAEEQNLGSLPRFLEFWDEKGLEEKVPLPESADAVRILTIHKSKGLQFPVCIVPFHNWGAGARPEPGVVELYGHRLLTRIGKNLGRPYYERQARNLEEQANLLYVAWTRAEEELFAFVPDVESGKGGGQRLGPVPTMLAQLLDIPPQDAGLELGAPPAPKTHSCAALAESPDAPPRMASGPGPRADETSIPPRTLPAEFQAWLPRLRVFRHSVEDAGFDERSRGKLAHKAVELLRPAKDSGGDAAAARRAVLLAWGEFPELRALDDSLRQNLQAQVEEMLLWLLGQGELRPHLGDGAELSILNAEGELLRPDLLRLTPGGAVVLEFKTGHAEPAHARQLAAYLELGAALSERRGRPPRARGHLVYLDRRIVESFGHVESGGRP